VEWLKVKALSSNTSTTKNEKMVQTKGIHNIFNKVIAENFLNFEKELSIQVQEASRTPNRLDQSRT
jgi:hypothetical protein